MSKQTKIPVHRMDEWFSGVYIKPLGAEKSSRPDYESAQPHRHDFYYCVLLEKGRLDLEVDFQKVHLTAPSLFLSYPGQIHQVGAAQMERGWFLAFDPSIPDGQLKTVFDQCLSEVIQLPLTAGQCAGFSSFIANLYAVYSDDTGLFRQHITQAMVTAFVYQLAAAYLSAERFNLSRHAPRSIEITKNFRQLLRRHFITMRKPADYAAEMNMTVSHLNDTVRSVTGFSVTYYIQQEVIREAQRLLYHSGYSVKEIADKLGFEDEKYFSRLFRNVAGISPGAFRKQTDTAVHVQQQ